MELMYMSYMLQQATYSSAAVRRIRLYCQQPTASITNGLFNISVEESET